MAGKCTVVLDSVFFGIFPSVARIVGRYAWGRPDFDFAGKNDIN